MVQIRSRNYNVFGEKSWRLAEFHRSRTRHRIRRGYLMIKPTAITKRFKFYIAAAVESQTSGI